MRLPTHRELAGTVLGITFATIMQTTLSLLFFLAVVGQNLTLVPGPEFGLGSQRGHHAGTIGTWADPRRRYHSLQCFIEPGIGGFDARRIFDKRRRHSSTFSGKVEERCVVANH